jgi:hypothetical protein
MHLLREMQVPPFQCGLGVRGDVVVVVDVVGRGMVRRSTVGAQVCRGRFVDELVTVVTVKDEP